MTSKRRRYRDPAFPSIPTDQLNPPWNLPRNLHRFLDPQLPFPSLSTATLNRRLGLICTLVYLCRIPALKLGPENHDIDSQTTQICSRIEDYNSGRIIQLDPSSYLTASSSYASQDSGNGLPHEDIELALVKFRKQKTWQAPFLDEILQSIQDQASESKYWRCTIDENRESPLEQGTKGVEIVRDNKQLRANTKTLRC